MNTKKVIPSIHIPIQKPDGSMEWVWYIFLQWLTDNFGNYFTKEEINEMLTAYALDDNVVHKTGNETIADKKTFIGTSSGWELPICIKNTDTHAIADQVPTGSTGKGISFVDKNGVLDGYIEFYRHQSAGRYLALNVTKNNQFYSSIVIGFNGNDDLYTSTPTPPVGSWDSFIANTEWVQNPDYSTNVVHRSGNENIAGIKEFTTWDGLRAKGLICVRGNQAYTESTSGWTVEGGLQIFGPNDNEAYGVFETIKDGDITYSQINVRGKDGNWTSSPLGIGKGVSGDTYTFAPTPNTNSWDNNIATTAFVRNLLDAIYPVGAIYLSITNYCPLQGICGNWELIQAGRALWTGNGQTGNYSWVGDKVTAAHNVIWEQLPNISGYATWDGTQNFAGAGGFAYSSVNTGVVTGVGSGYSQFRTILDFTASASSSIYSGTRVQPEAYVVNVWRRVS